MRRRVRLFALLALVGGGGIATAAPAEPTPEEQFASLSWLAGSWYGPHEKGHWEVCYTTPEGGVMLSANKEIIDAKVTLTPYPYGRKNKALFPLVEYDEKARRAVFTNPVHDFPRAIVYHRTAEDNLLITVSGEQGGRPMSLKLDLKRRGG